MKTSRWLIPVAAAVLAAVAILWWQMKDTAPPAPPEPPRVEAPPPAAPEAPPQIRYPIEAVRPETAEAPAAPPSSPLPPLDESDTVVQDALVALLGRESVITFLNTAGFVRRVVATVDNLPRKQAAVRLWPVQPTSGRFTTDGQGDAETIAAANSQRYEPFVRFVEGVDTGKAVALYVRLYPLFQRAYEDLGYPNRHFNDRVVEVIDHLLDAPELAGPTRVSLPEIKDPIKLERPWVLYEFADPALQARSAGQKILMRVGADNAARLKAKLREIRRQVAGEAKR